MNSANQPPAPHRPTDDQLEERIVAWVLGEASEFEIAALQSAIAARPELAVFKRRIEAAHGLVAEATRPAAEPLRLSPARRARLLATISSPVAEASSAVAGGVDPGQPASAQPKPSAPAKPSAARLPRPPARPWWRNEWLYSAAACVVISIGGFWMLSTVPKSHEYAEKAAVFDIPVPIEIQESSDALGALPEPLSEVADLEITVPPKSVGRSSANYSWSAPKAAAAPRIAPRPNAMVFAAGLERSKQAASSVAPSSQREVEVASARGFSGTTDDGSAGVLEPFVITEHDNQPGYKASATLAGTRIRTELKDLGSAVSVVSGGMVADKGANGSDGFLSKRKAERSGGKGGVPAPAAPALGGEAEEIMVLSPFEVAQDTSFLRGKRAPKQPKRPDPSATSAGPRSRGLDQNQVLLPEPSPQSTPSTSSTASARDADQPLPRSAQKPATPPPSADEVSAAQQPVSTFSLHVSDASFKLALAALAAGKLPDAAAIRPEEFYNAFDYGDPAPGAGEKVSCRIEQAAHPFAQQRNLVRIAVRVPATGRGSGTPLNLTVLLDTSGSMERPDRRAAVRAALKTLVGLLGPNDHLSLIGFARQPRLLAEAFDGAHANQALDLLDRTPAEGGTNLEEALKLGGELARRHFTATAQNRIVLLTDGAANLGNADPERLAAAIETLRSQRIAFDACGVGLEGIDDDMLEALTRKGDGRYYVLDSPEAADAGFARQLAGAFRPAAENVKLQVRFNPARVGRYRLVGFEKHRLREEDFRNDAVDAAELAAEEAAVAVYEVEALPQGEGELGEVFVRFRDAAAKTMVERSWTLPYESRAAAFDRASPSLQLAGTAAALAEKLRGGPAGDRVDLDQLAPLVAAQRARRPDDKRIQDLATMFEQLRRMKQ